MWLRSESTGDETVPFAGIGDWDLRQSSLGLCSGLWPVPLCHLSVWSFQGWRGNGRFLLVGLHCCPLAVRLVKARLAGNRSYQADEKLRRGKPGWSVFRMAHAKGRPRGGGGSFHQVLSVYHHALSAAWEIQRYEPPRLDYPAGELGHWQCLLDTGLSYGDFFREMVVGMTVVLQLCEKR